MNSAIKKILVIRLSSLGDILLTTPVLRALKKKFPESEIDFLTRESYADAINFNQNLNDVLLYENYENIKELINVLQNKNYNFVVDLQNNFRSREVTSSLDIKRYKYKKSNIKKFLLVNLKINLLKNYKTIPEKYVEAIPDLHLDKNGLELFIPQNINSYIEGSNFIGFCPGSRHYTKMWLEEYFVELGNKLSAEGYNVVLFGGESDIEVCNRISNKILGSVNLSNKNKLLQTAVDMKMCKLILCNDSGLMHTATAVGVPVVAMFGSTVKEFGFSPYNSNSLIIENNSLSCRPCSHIGRDKCPKKHFRCMRELTPTIVNKQLINYLRKI